MAQPGSIQDVRRIAANSLALEFTWRDDRWIHSLLLDQAGSPERLIAHFVDRGSPATPVFQDLAIQATETGEVALLVGLRDRFHDSGAFTATVGREGAKIEADFAVRAGKPLDDADLEPACVYAVDLPVVDLVEAAASKLVWVCREPEGLLTIEAGGDSVRLFAAEAGRRERWSAPTLGSKVGTAGLGLGSSGLLAHTLDKDCTP